MPLVNAKEMLLDAQRNHYAVGAFNVINMEMIQAVVAAAEEARSPVIVQTTAGILGYASAALLRANVAVVAENATVPVVIHLDHGNTIERAREAVQAGYTSVMFDGSQKPFEENIAMTRQVVEFCHAAGIPVEAELGKVGGIEDGIGSLGCAYTEPEDAAVFVERTGVDSLAVAIGTAHGVYKGIPKLDLDRLSRIREAVSIPLVMHGTSGVPEDAVRESIARGICKVNYATDLRFAFTAGVRDCLVENPEMYDPIKYLAVARERIKAVVTEKIHLCGSAGKA